jgi:hypothetical protein
MRKRPRTAKLAGRSTAPFGCGVSANSLYLTNAFDQFGHRWFAGRANPQGAKLFSHSPRVAPSSTLCRCSIKRNKNGFAGTFIDGTIVAIKARLVRLRSIAPIRGLFEGFLLAELAGMEHLDLETSAAAFRNQIAHVAWCPDSRTILVPGIGGANVARNSARRDGCQAQRDNKLDGPRKVSAAIHWQRIPLLRESAAGRKGSTPF